MRFLAAKLNATKTSNSRTPNFHGNSFSVELLRTRPTTQSAYPGDTVRITAGFVSATGDNDTQRTGRSETCAGRFPWFARIDGAAPDSSDQDSPIRDKTG